MWKLSQKEFDAVSALQNDDKVAYAVKRLADTRLVWLLQDEVDGWKMVEADDGRKCVPIWPHMLFAKACCEGMWKNAKPASVSVETFRDKWLTGMSADNLYVAVFPVPGMRGVVVDPSDFDRRLEVELAKY